MKHEKILSLIHCTVRAAALLALLIALAGAVAVYSAEPEVKVTFDKFEPGLLYYQAPHGNAYDIMGSEDLIHWRFLATTVMRGWTDRTPVWFRHTEPHRFFDFVKVQDFAFPDWDEFEDYELGLSVKPLQILRGTFRVSVYTSDLERGPWGQVEGSIEESLREDGSFHISSEPAWAVQMGGIDHWLIQIELLGEDGRRAQVVVRKELSDLIKHVWPNADPRGSVISINGPPSDWAVGLSLMVIEEEEIPVAE